LAVRPALLAAIGTAFLAIGTAFLAIGTTCVAASRARWAATETEGRDLLFLLIRDT